MKRIIRLCLFFFFTPAPLLPAFAPAARADVAGGVQALVRIEPAAVAPTSIRVAPGGRFQIANRSSSPARVIFDRRAAADLECSLDSAEQVRTGQFVLSADGAISCTVGDRSLSYTIFAPNPLGQIEKTRAKIVVRR